MIRLPRKAIYSFWLLAASTFVNPMASGQGKAAAPKELKIGITQEFENLNMLISQMQATTYISGFVNRTLVTLDPSAHWVPVLATRIPTIENGGARIVQEKNSSKIVAEWEIRPNAVWGDGSPIDGNDVVFSWQVARTNTVSVGEREVYDQVEKIDIDPKNPRKFTMTYKQAKWDYNQLGTFHILPQHLEKTPYESFKDQPEGYEKNSNYVKNPTSPGLYNGPYVISEIKLGSHVVLSANSKFYGSSPKIKRIVIKLIPNTATLEANLRSGNIDMISSLGLSFDQALAFEKTVAKESLKYKVLYESGLVYEHIDLQLANPVLQDVKVRKALVHAIDREELVKSLFEGKQKAAIHSIAPIDPWFTEDPNKIVKYEYSRRKAGKILDEAGWAAGPDGIRTKNGKKLSLQLMTTTDDKVRELVESYLQEKWRQIGVQITIKNEPARVFFGETIRKSKFTGMAMYAWVSAPESSPRANFHSSNIPTEKNGYSGQNAPRWHNSNVDKLIDKLELEFDPQKRKEISTDILRAYTDEVPVIPLYYRANISVVPKDLENYKMSGHQFSESLFAENWDTGTK